MDVKSFLLANMVHYIDNAYTNKRMHLFNAEYFCTE